MRVKCGLRCHVDKLAASEQLPASESTADRSVRDLRAERQGKTASRMRKRTALREIKEQRASWEILAGSTCSTNVKKWPKSPQPAFYRIVSRQNKMQ